MKRIPCVKAFCRHKVERSNENIDKKERRSIKTFEKEIIQSRSGTDNKIYKNSAEGNKRLPAVALKDALILFNAYSERAEAYKAKPLRKNKHHKKMAELMRRGGQKAHQRNF